jgi:hypothetical protein
MLGVIEYETIRGVASSEYGLPLGSTLKDRIASAVRYRYQDGGVLQEGDETLLIAIRPQFNSEKATVHSYIAAGRDLAASMPMHASIDEALNYWSAKPEAVQLGKLRLWPRVSGQPDCPPAGAALAERVPSHLAVV